MKKIAFVNFRDLNYAGGTPIRINALIRYMPPEVDVILLTAFPVPNDITKKIEIVNIPNIHKSSKYLYHLFFFYSAFPVLRPFLKKIIKNYKEVQILLKIFKKQSDRIFIFYEVGSESISFFRDMGFEVGYDVHGIVENDMIERSNLNIKKIIGYKSEHGKFKSSNLVISVSKEMQDYVLNKYPFIRDAQYFIAYDAYDEVYLSEPSESRVQQIREILNINESDHSILFAGSVKASGGFDQLLRAVGVYKKKYNSNVKLFLIINTNSILFNEGYFLKLLASLDIVDNVKIIGSVEKVDLIAYQRAVKLLVCPDLDAVYNHRCPHIKFFDCVASKVPTINGRFEAVLSLGFNEQNSHLYSPPGNDLALSEAIFAVFKDYERSREIAERGYEHLLKKCLYKYSTLGFKNIN